jgi:hypothetical protein
MSAPTACIGPRRVGCVVACCVALAAVGCDKVPTPAPKPPAPKVAEQVPAYTYGAPVKGHYKEINLGEFDVVDGVAYPAPNGTACRLHHREADRVSRSRLGMPMTLARSHAPSRFALSRVTLDKGVSKYYAAGSAFSGSSYETEVGDATG